MKMHEHILERPTANPPTLGSIGRLPRNLGMVCAETQSFRVTLDDIA